MRLSPFRRDHASGVSSRDRSGVLRRALDRAGIYYSPSNPEGVLAALPPASAPTDVRRALPQKFESPLPGPVKATFRTPLFRRERSGQGGSEVLVVTLNAALELTRSSAGTASALVVITSVADAPLAEHHRDLLWQSLG